MCKAIMMEFVTRRLVGTRILGDVTRVVTRKKFVVFLCCAVLISVILYFVDCWCCSPVIMMGDIIIPGGCDKL